MTETKRDELLEERDDEPAWLGDSPHPYEAHPQFPVWCARCPLPREHKVHAGAVKEQP